MGIRRNKTLLEQATDYVETAVESAREKAGPMLAEAKDRAGTALADARDQAGPALTDAKDRAVPLLAAGAAVAAEKASAVADLAAAKAAEGKEAAAAKAAEASGKKSHRFRTFVIFGAVVAALGFIASKLRSAADRENWESSYTPSPPPTGRATDTPIADAAASASAAEDPTRRSPTLPRRPTRRPRPTIRPRWSTSRPRTPRRSRPPRRDPRARDAVRAGGVLAGGGDELGVVLAEPACHRPLDPEDHQWDQAGEQDEDREGEGPPGRAPEQEGHHEVDHVEEAVADAHHAGDVVAEGLQTAAVRREVLQGHPDEHQRREEDPDDGGEDAIDGEELLGHAPNLSGAR
jgi:hypothetical protein